MWREVRSRLPQKGRIHPSATSLHQFYLQIHADHLFPLLKHLNQRHILHFSTPDITDLDRDITDLNPYHHDLNHSLPKLNPHLLQIHLYPLTAKQKQVNVPLQPLEDADILQHEPFLDHRIDGSLRLSTSSRKKFVIYPPWFPPVFGS